MTCCVHNLDKRKPNNCPENIDVCGIYYAIQLEHYVILGISINSVTFCDAKSRDFANFGFRTPHSTL